MGKRGCFWRHSVFFPGRLKRNVKDITPNVAKNTRKEKQILLLPFAPEEGTFVGRVVSSDAVNFLNISRRSSGHLVFSRIWRFPGFSCRCASVNSEMNKHENYTFAPILDSPFRCRAGFQAFNTFTPKFIKYILPTLTLSLPRVINFKILLQPHQKYNITQYGELGFS